MTKQPKGQVSDLGLDQAMRAVAVCTFLVAVSALGARATYGARVTADEPQYLLTALSLAEDQDLDISDEIATEAYRSFHEIAIDPQTTPLTPSGQELSPHDPLLPAVLAAPMKVGGWRGAKVALAALGALTAAATLWFSVRRLGTAVMPASVVVGSAFAAPPLTSYGTQIYPEMPAGLCAIFALGAALGSPHPVGADVGSGTPAGLPGAPRPWDLLRTPWIAVLGIVALPWLSIKYVPVAAVIAIVLLVRSGRREPLAAAAAIVALTAAGVAYLVVHQRIYGGWTVYASGDHFVDGEFTVVGQNPDYLGRSRRLIGLIIDRDFGLIAWTPAFVLLPASAVVLGRLRPPGWAGVLATVAAGYATAVWVALTMHGWWWPGRQVVVVLPLIVAAMAYLADRVRAVMIPMVGGFLCGTIAWLWLVVEASTGRRTLIFDFAESSNPARRWWRQVLPDYRAFALSDIVWSLFWCGVLAALAIWAWRRGDDTEESPTQFGGSWP